MSKTRFVQIRVDEGQFERIKNSASAKGYKTTSDYIRDLLLEKGLVFERKFEEIHRAVMSISQIIKETEFKKRDIQTNPQTEQTQTTPSSLLD